MNTQSGNIDIGFQSGNIYAAIARTCLRASKRSAKRKALLAVSREIVMELIAAEKKLPEIGDLGSLTRLGVTT